MLVPISKGYLSIVNLRTRIKTVFLRNFGFDSQTKPGQLPYVLHPLERDLVVISQQKLSEDTVTDHIN